MCLQYQVPPVPPECLQVGSNRWQISAELAALGHLNEVGQPFSAVCIRNMLAE
jgi:hypothetical protein